MRPTIVAANWKMNKTLQEGKLLTLEIMSWLRAHQREDLKLILLPSFIHLTTIHSLLTTELPLELGAQNCHEKLSGAFTGEVSSAMLVSAGAKYVLVGHSERRICYQEQKEILASKVSIALEAGMQPIFCCGERLQERESNAQDAYIETQLLEGLFHLSAAQIEQVIIAYEPVWAIGTGKTPDTKDIKEMQKSIRAAIAKYYSREIAEEIKVLYGGSCNAKNAKEFISIEGVDGVLVGNASLQATDFLQLLDAVCH